MGGRRVGKPNKIFNAQRNGGYPIKGEKVAGFALIK